MLGAFYAGICIPAPHCFCLFSTSCWTNPEYPVDRRIAAERRYAVTGGLRRTALLRQANYSTI